MRRWPSSAHQAREAGTLAAVRPQLAGGGAAARRRPGRARPAAREGRRAGAPARGGRDPVGAVVRLPHRVRGRSRRGGQRDLRRPDQRGHRRDQDRDRGPGRRRRHRRASTSTRRRRSPRRCPRSSARARSPAWSSPRSSCSSCSAPCSARPCRSSPRCSGVGVASLASLSFSGMVEFVSVTPVLGVMLGLAVGIDYSLFIINRHRRQLKQGADAARVDRAGQRHVGQRGRLRRRDRHRRAARAQRHRRRLPRPDGHRRRPSPSSSRS